MEIIITLTVSLLIIAFFLLFSFVEVIKKPLTTIALIIVFNSILQTLVSSISMLVSLIISVVIAVLLTILMFTKNKETEVRDVKFTNLLFGFSLIYLSFYHIASIGDSVLNIMGKDPSIILKLTTDALFLKTIFIQIILSLLVGGICMIFNKTFPTMLAGFIGAFVIVIFAIDGFSGNTNYNVVISTIDGFDYKNILSLISDKNFEVYSRVITDPNFLNVYIGLGFAVISSIITKVVKSKELNIF